MNEALKIAWSSNIMGLTSWLFGDKTEPVNTSQEVTADSTIHFHPDLIATLLDEHQAILAIYNEIVHLVHQQPCDSAAINSKVAEFRVALQSHTVTENVKIYGYLEHKFNNDPAKLKFIKESHKELNDIGHAAIHFVHRYQNANFTEQLRRDFIKDLTSVGRGLTKRIAKEESQLYTLYKS